MNLLFASKLQQWIVALIGIRPPAIEIETVKVFQYFQDVPKNKKTLSYRVYRTGQPNWKHTMRKFQDFLPLRFYVKLILVILNLHILTFWILEQLWILNYWEFLSFQVWNFSTNQNYLPPKLLKWQFYTFWNKPKFHVKSD